MSGSWRRLGTRRCTEGRGIRQSRYHTRWRSTGIGTVEVRCDLEVVEARMNILNGADASRKLQVELSVFVQRRRNDSSKVMLLVVDGRVETNVGE